MPTAEIDLVPLSTLASILGGYAFKSSDFGPAGYRVVKIADIRPPRIDVDGCERIPLDKVVGLDRFRLKDMDILLAMTGATTGKAGRLRSSEPAYLNQRVAKVSAKGGATFNDYIWAVVSQPGFDLRILQHAHGSAQPNISADGIGQILVPRFPDEDQLRIGRFIRLLDDKIELNRRMNATLEAIARAIFKSWFVDFDPVRAKQQGLPPRGLYPAASGLFPADFQPSELGSIPTGWKVEPVGEVVSCVGGGTPSTADPTFWENGTNFWATPKDLSSLGVPILVETERSLTDKGVARVSSGLLPAGTVLLSSRAPVGYLAVAAVPLAINQGFIALKPNSRASAWFLLNWCESNMEAIKARASGTTFAEISKKSFRPIQMVIPPPDVMQEFTKAVEPLYARIILNVRQSRTLMATRDSLLPKLLSGSVSLPSAAGDGSH